MSLIDDFLTGYVVGKWSLNEMTPGSVYNIAIENVGDTTGLSWVCNARQYESSTTKLLDFTITVQPDPEIPTQTNVYLTGIVPTTENLPSKIPSLFVALDVFDTLEPTKKFTFYKGYIPVGNGGAIHD